MLRSTSKEKHPSTVSASSEAYQKEKHPSTISASLEEYQKDTHLLSGFRPRTRGACSEKSHLRDTLTCGWSNRTLSSFRSCFAVFATHILSGEVDTTLCLDGVGLASRIWWLLHYFNPVNICWRYYSMIAYRVLAKQWGILSSQGLLSIIAAYQGIMAIQFTISATDVGYLATLSKPFAMLGLFRVMVSQWIASKVYMDPFAYPHGLVEVDYKSNKVVVCGWLMAVCGLVFLSFYPYIGYPEFNTLEIHYLDLTMEIFYQYVTLSILLFHVMALSHGPIGLANRIVYFDHWSYKLQTIGFIFTFCGMLAVGLEDFIKHDFYSFCKDV